MNRLFLALAATTLSFGSLAPTLHAAPLTGNTITDNGTYTVVTRPGRTYAFSVAGSFGGGSLAINWRDDNGNTAPYADSPATAAEYWTFTATTNQLDLVLTGATAPSLTLTIAPADGGSLAVNQLSLSLDRKASSALQKPVESLPSTVLFHDGCEGDPQSFTAAAQDRIVSPGPGTARSATYNGSSIIRYEHGTLKIGTIAGTGAQINSVKVKGPNGAFYSWTAAAGMTIKARLIPSFVKGGSTRNSMVGFSHNDAPAMRRGQIYVTNSNGDTAPTINISVSGTLTDDGQFFAGKGLFEEGDEIGLAVELKTLSHQRYWMQGGRMASFGALVGSNNWILLGETFTDFTGQEIYPQIGGQYDGVTVVKDWALLSSFNPSPRHAVLDYNRTGYAHIPSLGKDPATGLIVCGWNNGPSHWTTGAITIKYSTKLASGWTAPATLLAPVVDPAQIHISSISSYGGKLWLHWIYATNRNNAQRYIKRAELTVNASTGAVTMGTSQDLNIDIELGTSPMNPIITLSGTGRLYMPHHASVPGITSYYSYSDNNGATWTTGQIPSTTNMGEPTFIEEADGGVGCIMRSHNASLKTAYYSRTANPNASTPTWTAPVAIAAIPQPAGGQSTAGSRMCYTKLTDGTILLAGNDDDIERGNMTVWTMGTGGSVLGKTFIGDWGPVEVTGNSALLQYPAIIGDGDDIITAVSRQPSNPTNGGTSIQIDNRRWASPVPFSVGGNERTDIPVKFADRPIPKQQKITYNATSITPDMSVVGDKFVVMTGNIGTINAPVNGLPWERLRITFVQDATGSRLISAWNAAYQMNGATTTLSTAPNAANTFNYLFNPISNTWVLENFN